MTTNYCDSHTHLCDEAFDADRASVIAAAGASGVTLFNEIACRAADWDKALTLCSAHPGKFYCALGIHPQDCGDLTEDNLARLRGLMARPEVMGLGEIGLDYARGEFSEETQKETFTRLLEFANGCGKPLVLHCRNPFAPGGGDAYADLFALLRARWSPPSSGKFSGILHCFSGSRADAEAAADLGLLIGINGTISYPKNSGLRETARALGPARLTLETDCPYLPPQPLRGKRNEPANIPAICAALSKTLGIGEEETARAARDNFSALLELS